MNFNEWEPWYCEILDYFGFSRADDEKAARQTRLTVIPG